MYYVKWRTKDFFRESVKQVARVRKPREATGRIVCANCHLAQKPVDIEVPQAVLPDSVFEAVVKIPYNQEVKQVLGNGKKGGLNVGAVLILPDGFTMAPADRMSAELKEKLENFTSNHIVKTSKTFLLLVHKSNNTVYNAAAAGKIAAINPTEKGTDVVIDKVDGGSVTVAIPSGPDLLVSVGDTVAADQPITNNPNVGGFGQGETEIVLQNPARLQGLVIFLGFVLIAQVFLVLKKKQFEKVQLSEMNF
ncbi:cytochrome f large domain-containing protein [Ostreococcus tauri]|uniref:Cytochrome f n=1 Tax=Ostreococcus tauri TaxID=70448 RepID=A0A1Y5IBN3_OSTTA|nr:cytochrome f large domain-containing protein [Ostreococcus tauri]